MLKALFVWQTRLAVRAVVPLPTLLEWFGKSPKAKPIGTGLVDVLSMALAHIRTPMQLAGLVWSFEAQLTNR
jgi:hypothetical protein